MECYYNSVNKQGVIKSTNKYFAQQSYPNTSLYMHTIMYFGIKISFYCCFVFRIIQISFLSVFSTTVLEILTCIIVLFFTEIIISDQVSPVKFVFLVAMSTGLFLLLGVSIWKTVTFGNYRTVGETLGCASFPSWYTSVEDALGTWGSVFSVYKRKLSF